MFPTINVATVKLADCRRIVLFNHDAATGTVEMRHYAVRALPTGINKAIKRVSARTRRQLRPRGCMVVQCATMRGGSGRRRLRPDTPLLLHLPSYMGTLPY
jgi:Brix domain